MDNSITGIGTSAPTPLSYARRESAAVPVDDAQPLAIADNQPRIIGRGEHMDDSTVRMQDRLAEREEKAKASGYEHLANAAATRIESTAGRRPAPIDDSGGAAGLMDYHRTQVPERFHERVSELFNKAQTQIEERVASLGQMETGELDAAAVENLALRATATWDAVNTEIQDRYAIAADKATDSGRDRLAARLGDQAQALDTLNEARTDNILERSAELIDRMGAGASLPAVEAVDLQV